MCTGRFVFVVALFICFTGVTAVFSQNSIAVLNIRSEQLKPGDCIAVTSFLTTELQKIGKYKIISWDDVTKMLEHQAGKQALGCDDDKCIAEIGGALGVEMIVAGDIGQVGSSYIMNVRLIDIKKSETIKRASGTVSADMGLLIDKMPGMVQELFGGAPAVTPKTSTSGGSVSGSGTSGTEGMVWIEGGTFKMGSNDGRADGKPVHEVTVSGFWMDKTEVTQAEYERVMGKTPSHFKGCPTCPVENVSWHAAKAYCEKVGKRLPTEAEWEYAARAGSTTKCYWGDQIDGAYAWYRANSGMKTNPVGQKKPNAWGLYDMSGNVYEWCSDWYDENYYSKSPSQNPLGPPSGTYRVLRGGSWYHSPVNLRSAYRLRFGPDDHYFSIGFRCVRSR